MSYFIATKVYILQMNNVSEGIRFNMGQIRASDFNFMQKPCESLIPIWR